MLLLQQIAYLANALTWRIIRFLEKSEEEELERNSKLEREP